MRTGLGHDRWVREGPRHGRVLWWRFVLAAAVAACAGCAKPAGVLFESSDGVHEWPPPPDVARIRYLGQLRTVRDLKPGRGAGEGLRALLFGNEAVHGMLSPISVCTDGGQRVFVADSNAQVVHVFDLDSREYARWRPAEDQVPLSQPVGVACDAGGRVLVSDSVAGCVFVFDAAGTCTGTMGKERLQRPCGIAVSGVDGRVFVADSGVHQVVVFSPAGEEVARLGSRGSGVGEFNFPTNVALDGLGRVYVSDSLNFRVQVFTPSFEPLRQIGSKGDLPGYFSQPKGLALDQEGHLYVVDANFEAVQLFDPEGRLLMSFGREGRGPGEFWLPAGMCIDPMGRLFIADTYNQRVQVFQYLPEQRAP